MVCSRDDCEARVRCAYRKAEDDGLCHVHFQEDLAAQQKYDNAKKCGSGYLMFN